MRRAWISVLLVCLPVLGANALAGAMLGFELDNGAVVLVGQDGSVRFGGTDASSIAYDATQQHVQKLGALQVEYDSTMQRVVRIGGVDVQYDDAGQKVIRVGGIEIAYDAQGMNVTAVGKARLTYDPAGQRVTGVTGSVGKGMFLTLP